MATIPVVESKRGLELEKYNVRGFMFHRAFWKVHKIQFQNYENSET